MPSQRAAHTHRVRLVEHVEAERSELAELLGRLSPEELDHPSLCQGWSVRDVAAHAISYDRLNPFVYAVLFVFTGLSINRTNKALVWWWRRRDLDRLMDAYRRSPRPRGMMRLLGSRIALLDVLVHQQDIRRPLDRPREIPPARTEAVARILVHHRIGAGGASRARHLRFEATDAGWTVGTGEQTVSGPAEAIVTALAGRADALQSLEGDGFESFTARVAGRG